MIQWADFIVTCCENADENCPMLPVKKKKFYWPIEDPEEAMGTEEQIVKQYQNVRDKIHEHTGGLITNLRHNVNQKIALGLVGIAGAAVTFTLEVLGASGAFWGATEVFHLRNSTNPENNDRYQYASMGIGGLALLRYIAVHMLSPHKQRNYLRDIDQEGGLGKIYQAFENPIPAIKTSIVSLIYKAVRPTYKFAHPEKGADVEKTD
jgi:hypothetical protein